MKLKIYEETGEERVAEEVYLKLEQDEGDDGEVRLAACDKNGKKLYCGSLITISEHGIFLHILVNRELGFSLGENGQLEICE